MKGIALFLLTNLAVLLVLGVVLSIVLPTLGLEKESYSELFFICAIFGIGGLFISLAMSKWLAKPSAGAQVIETAANELDR
jgi:heat shock protein HtpX|tara:strand:- start:553 stop:795 length:243 start_codon:yes stop_codon:yes gene_type:complete